MSINSSKTSFTNKWIQYGKENEATARSYYTKYQRAIHDNFKCSESGLILNRDYPHLGASPDGLAQCDCCGQGCLEIKCLPTYMNGIPDPLGETCTSFPISSDFQLKKTHKFYTQIQGHMLITGRKYCDLYMWSQSNSLAVREYRDEQFLKKLSDKLELEYKSHVIPALISAKHTGHKQNK